MTVTADCMKGVCEVNTTENLLTILAEECAEAAQRASKAIRFGLTEVQPGQSDDNVRRLERELADVVAVAEMIGLQIRDADKAEKKRKVLEYTLYSQKIGTVEAQGGGGEWH